MSLVVAVSLASAVQRRQPEVTYHTHRDTGTVAARTIRPDDGRVDVIIESGFLTEVDAYGQGRFTAARQPQLRRRGLAQIGKPPASATPLTSTVGPDDADLMRHHTEPVDIVVKPEQILSDMGDLDHRGG
jgi:hypothetical protein